MPDGQMREITAGRYAYPYWFRDKISNKPAFLFEEAIVIIEEYGQASPDVKRGLASIIWEYRSGEHKLPERCGIIMMSNRPEDRSGVGKDFDFMINRRSEMEVRAELDPWLVWAHDNHVSNTCMAFGARNTDKVFSNKAPEKQGPWLTPRSLVMADKFVREATEVSVGGYGLDEPFVRQNIGGMIGEGNAHIYVAFAKIRDTIPSMSAILSDPDNCRVPKEADVCMFLVFDLASKATRDNFKLMVRYLKRMPSDFAIAFYRSAVQRDPTLRSTKEFGDWAMENTTLLQAVQR
jgi:hypothetical protein